MVNSSAEAPNFDLDTAVSSEEKLARALRQLNCHKPIFGLEKQAPENGKSDQIDQLEPSELQMGG